MKKKLIPILIITLTNLLISNSSYKLFEYELDPVSTSMRNGNISHTPSITSALINPAGMNLIKNNGINLSYLKGFTETYNINIRANYNLDSLSSLFITNIFQNYGDFKRVDKSSYQSYENIFSVGYSRKVFNNLYGGGNLKYYYGSIDDYSSSVLAVDLNIFYRLLNRKLSLSLGMFNLGTQLSEFNGVSEKLPTALKIGASNKLDRLPLEISFQYNRFFEDEENEYILSAEFIPNENLEIRAGYNFSMNNYELGTGEKIEQFSGLSLGLGINIAEFEFDIAYPINGYLENQINMGLTYNFGKTVGSFFGKKGKKTKKKINKRKHRRK
ncbi:MAG: hypothetical protein CR982_07880 [Candidatus Cloacimonadota bacterium]|nr:MAG: hypothetical protein CR982_07880 [Candidatus Cloacimonadota bacterium]PIE78226.1 MAG: hypothetical protein CSA15_08660 [Candidatus Delongbacteria bacterium]